LIEDPRRSVTTLLLGCAGSIVLVALHRNRWQSGWRVATHVVPPLAVLWFMTGALPAATASPGAFGALGLAVAALVVAQAAVVGLQVVGRHVLHQPIPWTEEVARLLLGWLMCVGGILALRHAQHPRVTAVGFADVLVMLPLLALGVSLPTPGGVGGYHALMQFGLTALFGVDPTVAAGAGILMHLAIVLPVLVLGPVLLYTEKVSWSDLVAAGRKVRALGHAERAVEAAG